MTELLQAVILWPLLWVLAGLGATKLRPQQADTAGIVGLLFGVLFSLAMFGTPASGHYLSAMLLWPALGAFVVLFVPRQWTDTVRRLSSLWMWAGFVFSLWLLGPVCRDAMAGETGLLGALWSGEFQFFGSVTQFGPGLQYFFGAFAEQPGFTEAGYRFVEDVAWIEAFGIHYKLGIDGISLWLIILTTLLTPIGLAASWNSVNKKVKEFGFAFLLLQVGMMGAFLSLDIFLFYIFWELMLVPMYLIIGIWGGKQRVYAAVKFFIYTMVGSLLMLVAIAYVVLQYREFSGGVWTFDLETLSNLILPRSEQLILFMAFGLAFAIKVPMFPFHTWLPDAHVQAPTGGSVILAAVLLKLGSYGFLRFAMPLFDYAAFNLGATLAGFAIVGIIYGALCAWVQRDVKKLVAYSSVSHLGFVMLGIFGLSQGGISGSILQMVSHGISTGALFILVGVIYDRRHTRDLNDFGGIAKVMPAYTVLFIIVTMSSVGLPGTNGFIGEFMILSSSFSARALNQFGPIQTFFAATGVVLAAIYMLHAVLKIFWGPLKNEKNEKLTDLTSRERWILAPLIFLIFWIGIFPNFFLRPMEAAVDHLVATTTTQANEAQSDAVAWAQGVERPTPPEADDSDAANGEADSGETAEVPTPSDESPQALLPTAPTERLALVLGGSQ